MPATFKAVLNDKPKQDGSYPILIRITQDRVRRYVNSGFTVKKSEFNTTAGKVRTNNARAQLINETIKDKIRAVETKISKKEREGSYYNIDEIRDLLSGKPEKEKAQYLLPWFNEMLELYYPLPSRLVARRHMLTTLEALKELEAKQGKKIAFKNLDLAFIKTFQNFLMTPRPDKSGKKEKPGNKPNTVAQHLKRLKRCLNLAVEHEIMPHEKNPFLRVKIKRAKTTITRLTIEEVRRLEELELPAGRMRDARNAWLLQFYCAGTRIGDMITMRFGNIENGRLLFNMQKTEEQVSIKLSEKALALINEYRTEETKPEDFILPFLDRETDYSDMVFLKKQIWSKTAQINENLKLVATRAGIDKNLTTHMARHSFADIARQKTGDIYGISKALRHSSTRQTETYFQGFDDRSVDGVLDSVMDY